MKYLYEITPEEKKLIDIIRGIKYGVIQEISVRDGALQLAKVMTPPEVHGVMIVESVKLGR